MRILLTNDDGIDSPGLHALRQIAAELSDDVWVVAPETNQSGASHSLTLHEPLRLRQVDERAFAVRGTPTDSVIMGVRHILKDKPPDLVLSGINRGANMAEDVTYSGTIAGAFEGTILGIRSIALSQAYGDERAQGHQVADGAGARAGADPQAAGGWSGRPSACMNINFPDREPDDVVGTVVTTQGKRDPGLLQIDERHDTWGNPYYWLAFERRRSNAAGGHRSVGGLFRPHLGDAAVPRPDAPGDARGAGGGVEQIGSRNVRRQTPCAVCHDCPLPTADCRRVMHPHARRPRCRPEGRREAPTIRG